MRTDSVGTGEILCQLTGTYLAIYLSGAQACRGTGEDICGDAL